MPFSGRCRRLDPEDDPARPPDSRLTYPIWLKSVGGADACILPGCPHSSTHPPSYRRCCCPRRLVRPRLSGKNRGGSHSFGLLRRPAGIQLVLDQGPDLRRNRPPPPVSLGGAA